MPIRCIPQVMAKTGECIDSYDNKADFLIAVARMEKAAKRANITRELVLYNSARR